MKNEPCNVCGSTDLNLIDGFYYCVECGTQDVNVRETVVEQTYLADGTLALVGTKKFSTVVKDGIEMSGEWHKWHAYNFILAGLTDELINLGAKPSVKMKVLWIWARYIKKFQVKEDMELRSKIGDDSLSISRITEDGTDSVNTEPEQAQKVKKKEKTPEKFTKDIKIVTKGLLLAILYIALNLDKSDIQLSHLFRFIKEGRLSFWKCIKFVPKEIDTISIPHWKSFMLCQVEYNSHSIRAYAMTCMKYLDLGVPNVPDLKKIVNNYVTELCLPNDFKNLVLSLMVFYPCDYLDMDKMIKKFLVRIPDYEVVAMSYVLIALKMCFGLDCDYELRISDKVDIINYEENHLKSHKLGMFSEPTDRLFSFREWVRFLQFRKIVLCQHYLPMARQHNKEVNEYVLMEQLEERSKRPIKLRDEVTMDILNKIPNKIDFNIIPKSEFHASLTPMSTYTDVVLNYVLDDVLRLLLSEDFTQYSLKYATELKSLNSDTYPDSIIEGVSDSNKIVESAIKRNFESRKGDATMVFVRNCENKNWLKTNPPTADHITKVKNEASDRESDHGYDSNIENTPVTEDADIDDVLDEKLECFEEENENINIFDDHFQDLFQDNKSVTEPHEFGNDDYINDYNNSNYDGSEHEITKFDPDNFDKKKIIDELITLACEKYKIPMPRENVPRKAKKRQNENINSEAGESTPKRKRTNKTMLSEAKIKLNDMIAAYYKHLENDVLTKVTEQVRHVIDTLHNTHENVYNATAEDYYPPNDEMENVSISEAGNTSIYQNANAPEEIVNSVDFNNTCETDFVTEITNEEDDQLNASIHDPNFDEKTHDTRQLYIKLKHNVIDDIIHVSVDPDVDRIIDQKIEEFRNYGKIVNETKDETKNEEDFTDTDEDTFDILEEQKFQQEKKKNERNLEPLIEHPVQMKKFQYWIRHYSAQSIGKNLDMHQKFDIELTRMFPASFNFLISECACILGCSTYSLYKCMQNLEEMIIAKSKNLSI